MHQEQDFSSKSESVRAVLDKYERDPHKLIAILSEIQARHTYLQEDVMAYVATELGVPPASVFGVATFYAHFTMEPKGKYVIKVCDGTACHVKKSEDIIKTIESALGLSKQKRTSEDMLFTLETVACLGACGLAPVIVVNEDVYGGMTKDKTIELIDNIRKGEAANA